MIQIHLAFQLRILTIPEILNLVGPIILWSGIRGCRCRKVGGVTGVFFLLAVTRR